MNLEPNFEYTMSELPWEIMYDILSRMPVKSLARFRCVSKLWCSYIDDSYLETLHAKRADPNIIIFHLQRDCDKQPKSVIEMLHNKRTYIYSVVEMSKKPTGTGTTIDLLRQEPPAVSSYDHDNILGSCKGLLYSSYQTHRNNGHAVVAVIDPIKKECYVLPLLKLERRAMIREESFGLGFDDSTNTFKMVCIGLREKLQRTSSSPCDVVRTKVLRTMVYVLASNKSKWRYVSGVPSYRICGQEGVFAHGFLHWLVSDLDNNWRTHYQKRPIIRFDVKREEYAGLINVPKQTSSKKSEDRLFDLNGQVGFVYDNVDNFTMEVWVLNHTEWVMQCRFDKTPPLPKGFIKVLGVWNKDGDILITYSDEKGKLFVYGLKSGFFLEANSICHDLMWITDIRMYQSSLFSVHYSIKN